MHIKRWESVEIIKCSYRPDNGFELSGQGTDKLISYRRASLVRCSDWL